MRFRRQRKPNVAKLKRRGDLAGLRAALRFADDLVDREGGLVDVAAPVRAEAAGALAEFYGPIVTDALVEALRDPDERVRMAAVRGLRKLGSPDAAAPLIDVVVGRVEDGNGLVEAEALATLEELPAPRLPERFAVRVAEAKDEAPSAADLQALQALISFDDRGPGAARAVVEQLAERLADPRHDVAARAERLLESLAADGVDELIAHLDGGPERVPAARLLGASRDSRAVDPLVGMLHSPDAEARFAAASALGKLRDTRAVEPLLYATRDPEYKVRDAALRSLDNMGAGGVMVGLAALVSPLLTSASADGTSNDQLESAPWAQRMMGRLLAKSATGGE